MSINEETRATGSGGGGERGSEERDTVIRNIRNAHEINSGFSKRDEEKTRPYTRQNLSCAIGQEQ